MGVVVEIVEKVEKFAEANSVEMIDTLVLQVGEFSPMVPRYIEAAYPAAIEKTKLQNTKLQIEVIPANGRCTECAKVFRIIEHNKKCPKCGSGDFELLTGNEFMIKEILCI